MLGCTINSNDIFVFFEDDELTKLSNQKISGTYIDVNNSGKIGKLETLIDDKNCKKYMTLIITKIQKDSDNAVFSMNLSIMQRVYKSITENGKYSSHEGYRHITLLDANRLEFSDDVLYKHLKMNFPNPLN